MAAERQEREKVRRHIVEELVSSERSYVDKLLFLKRVRHLPRFLHSLHYFKFIIIIFSTPGSKDPGVKNKS